MMLVLMTALGTVPSASAAQVATICGEPGSAWVDVCLETYPDEVTAQVANPKNIRYHVVEPLPDVRVPVPTVPSIIDMLDDTPVTVKTFGVEASADVNWDQIVYDVCVIVFEDPYRCRMIFDIRFADMDDNGAFDAMYIDGILLPLQ